MGHDGRFGPGLPHVIDGSRLFLLHLISKMCPSSADKGILITTGYFTSDAVKMAQEKGLKPIELINGDQLVKLMEELQLGLRQTYVVDQEFFDDFADGVGK